MNSLYLVSEWHPALIALRDWLEDEEERLFTTDRSKERFDELVATAIRMNVALLRRDGSSHELPRWAGRKEDMSERDTLEMIRQDDGDWIVTIKKHDQAGIARTVSVEFCTPGTGGGGSRQTFRALNALALAMAADSTDPREIGRTIRPQD